jgi:hypothetical protein
MAAMTGLLATGAAAATDRFDGAWSVVVLTERGNCSPTYQFPILIEEGRARYGGTGASQSAARSASTAPSAARSARAGRASTSPAGCRGCLAAEPGPPAERSPAPAGGRPRSAADLAALEFRERRRRLRGSLCRASSLVVTLRLGSAPATRRNTRHPAGGLAAQRPWLPGRTSRPGAQDARAAAWAMTWTEEVSASAGSASSMRRKVARAWPTIWSML